jgi:predicted dehydrogenase
MPEKIRVGLASFGMSGKVFHAPLISANGHFQLRKIMERSSNKSKEFYPDAEIVRNFDDLIDDANIDLIVVNTPDHLHFEMTKAALQKGKHVVAEKPFTLKSEEAKTLIDLAEKENKLLSVFQNRRWDGDFLTARKVVEGKLLGRLVEFESHYDRYRNFIQEDTWKEEEDTGTGILYNLGAHMIDQALVLFGMPNAVTAHLGITRTGGRVIDNFDLRMEYNELKVLIRSGYLVREAGPRYSLHGTLGSFVKYGIDPQEDMLKAGFLPYGDDWGKEPEDDWGFINTDASGLHIDGHIETLNGDYPAFYNNIAVAIKEGAPLAVKPEEAMQVIKIIELAMQSHHEKRTVLLD